MICVFLFLSCYIFALSEPLVVSLDCRRARVIEGTDFLINLTLKSKPDSARVEYQVNYGPTTVLSMSARGDGGTMTAIIPFASFKSRNMIKWKVFVEDGGHVWSFADREGKGNSSSCGACVLPLNNSLPSDIPILEWWTPSGSEALTVAGALGGSICWRGVFYDGVGTRRRGVTSLSFKKPKLAFKVEGGGFELIKGRMDVKSFDLSNLYFELGEKSMMKEMLSLQVLQEAGVISSIAFYVSVFRNGQWFGLFGMLEVVDNVFLKQRGLDPNGPLFKANAGEESNLRYDIPTDQLRFYYKGNRKNHSEDWELLSNLTLSLAGGGEVPRSQFLFQAFNLPSIINQMAAQTLVLNMDRCTKNFFLHLDPLSSRWTMIPWDLDGSFGQDNGYEGKSGDNFAVLIQPQWNSPLYCDFQHPQDMRTRTPYGWVSINLNTYQGPSVKSSVKGRMMNEASLPLAPLSAQHDHRDPDENGTHRPSTSGVLGTYNHLIDSILRVPATRSMYLRRLQTLVDRFLVSGRILELAKATYLKIKDLAIQDQRLWETGIDAERGMLQITTEFLPTRLNQMRATYGPTGTTPLLPGPQSTTESLRVSKVGQSYVILSNPSPQALDVSDQRLSVLSPKGGEIDLFTFAPGTVVPSGQNVVLVHDLGSWQAEGLISKGMGARLVLSPLAESNLERFSVSDFKLYLSRPA